MSRLPDHAEAFLQSQGFERAPWLVVAFGTGVGAWFVLPWHWHWLAAIAGALVGAMAAQSRWRGRDDRIHLKLALTAALIAFACGVALVWARSEIVGVRAIEQPRFGTIVGKVLAREERPDEGKVRLTIAVRDAEEGRAIKVRVNIDAARDDRRFSEAAVVRLRARLMPPSAPIVPGAYDFARKAWFEGLAATGSAVGPVELVSAAPADAFRLAQLQRRIARMIRERVPADAGAIAATLATGDRSAMSKADTEAMRDAGLTHLLSISGVHVSAVMALAYGIIFRLLALWPWFALRWRVPLVALLASATAGVGYTLLTGAEVPTVRSCMVALLVVAGVALGREPLSLRLLAAAAAFVLVLWPETLIGPSFQMSFAAVLAIISLHRTGPVVRFLAPREESWITRRGRILVMLFATGIVIEFALMPIVLFHFHRAGFYGALANVVAIPLVTFVSMPLLALALALEPLGLGGLAWWAVGQSLELLLAIARSVAAQPGAVGHLPQFSHWLAALFVAGALWLSLWQGRARLLGLLPMVVAGMLLSMAQPVDVLVARGGTEVIIAGGVAGSAGMVALREGEADSYSRETMTEVLALGGEVTPMRRWSGARCSEDFCSFTLAKGGRNWQFLVARSRRPVEERALAAACDGVDVVIADRWLPRSCQPRWLKADRNFLDRQGGFALDLAAGRVRTVAQGQGEHGWWQPAGVR